MRDVGGTCRARYQMNEQISGDCRAERAAVELISRSSGAARKGEGEKLPPMGVRKDR